MGAASPTRAALRREKKETRRAGAVAVSQHQLDARVAVCRDVRHRAACETARHLRAFEEGNPERGSLSMIAPAACVHPHTAAFRAFIVNK